MTHGEGFAERPSGAGRRPRFASLLLDADSTLAGIEGVDWLAERRNPSVAREVAALTRDAMSGAVPLESVYVRRLELIAPTADEVAALADAYLAALAPGAAETVRAMAGAGVVVHVVSGGLLPALLPLAGALGIPGGRVHAVDPRFDGEARFQGIRPTPLATRHGKAEVARSLGLPRPALAVGDGDTDLAMRPAVDAFAAYVGFVRRDAVVRAADYVVGSFGELEELVLGGGSG